jgi:hypothetical protein
MGRMISIRIHYSHRSSLVGLLALALLVLAWSSYLAWGEEDVAALTPLSSGGMRQYYLSRSYVQADGTLSACASGYHFASIWEIADPSSLKYNTTLGQESSDSGQGPPTALKYIGRTIPALGWVRTGHSSDSGSSSGQANCNVWSSKTGFQAGTVASLPTDWTGGEQDIGVWNTGTRSCDFLTNVWCVQDDSSWAVYLPLVLNR